jgi:hypothetical protein
MKNLFALSMLIILTFSCNEEDLIPETFVNFQIQASDIGGVGQAIYTDLSYGVRGIVIYHSDIDQYIAYDRACSYRPSDPCEVIHLDDENSPTYFEDECCDSRFLITDGTPFSGPAIIPLKRYNTSYDGVYVRVYN